MTVEYFAYQTDPTPLPIPLLAERCRQRGYAVRILWEFNGWTRFREITDGVMQSEDVVCGWRIGHPLDTQVLNDYERRSPQELTKHESADRVGVFEVEVWNDPAAYNSELETEAEGHPAEYAATRSSSTSRWYVRVASGVGALPVELAEVFLGVGLELRGGLLEDPQEGTYRLVQSERLRSGDEVG